MCCCRVTARAVRPLARAPRGSARSPPSPPGACSLKPARGSHKEIKTRAWGKEGCEIMHHFIWPVKHQRSAIGAAQDGEGRTRHWGARSKAVSPVPRQRRCKQGGSTQEKPGCKNTEVVWKLSAAAQCPVLHRGDGERWERAFDGQGDEGGCGDTTLLPPAWHQAVDTEK